MQNGPFSFTAFEMCLSSQSSLLDKISHGEFQISLLFWGKRNPLFSNKIMHGAPVCKDESRTTLLGRGDEWFRTLPRCPPQGTWPHLQNCSEASVGNTDTGDGIASVSRYPVFSSHFLYLLRHICVQKVLSAFMGTEL